jgi:hypothetical protein
MGTSVEAGEPAGGARRALTRRETAFWYAFAGVTYVVASLWQKGLLNWFVGPAWLVACVWFGPLVVDAARSRIGRRR